MARKDNFRSEASGARAWSQAPLLSVTADVDGKSVALTQQAGRILWDNRESRIALFEGVYGLIVTAEDEAHRKSTDKLRIAAGRGSVSQRIRHSVDLENALDAWEERGLLGTQLGPNKNGREW